VRGNYCTYNPIARSGISNATLANGNLDISGTGSSYTGNLSTIAVSSGKWYYEFTVTNAPNNSTGAGIVSADTIGSANGGNAGFGDCSGGYLRIGTVVYNNGSAISTGLSSIGTGDIVNVAFDLDAGKIWFGKNGTWDSSGNPATGSNAVATFTPAGRYFYIFAQGFYGSGTWSGVLNAGARPFAYTAPSGFKALNTSSLPSPLVTKPSTVMDVALWSGNGGSQTITLPGAFSPDFVWIKRRSSTFSSLLYDTVRGNGPNKGLISDSTTAEGGASDNSTYGYLSAFNSDGFSLTAGTTSDYVNTSGQTYVGWTWDAGSSTVTNTAGSISSQVRANPSAGFSIVTYTGSTGNYTFGHGLGAAPKLVLIKNRSASANWFVITDVTGSWTYGFLNSTDALAGPAAQSASSTVVNLANNAYNWFNANGDNYVAYCFAPVAGYSSFGSYTGNGSSDGPFVYTGFRPRFVMLKGSSFVSNWHILDAARNAYNVTDSFLRPNLSSQEFNGITEGAGSAIDILSNGFKLRASFADSNTNAASFVWAAFAESPFQYARAR
jgi:hypothetical protein